MPPFPVPLRLAFTVRVYFDAVALFRKPFPYTLPVFVPAFRVVGSFRQLAVVCVPAVVCVVLPVFVAKPKPLVWKPFARQKPREMTWQF